MRSFCADTKCWDFSPNIVYACWEDAFMGCEWKYHVSQHFVKYMKHHQKSSFLICGRISECIICFPLWEGFYFSSSDFCSWIFCSMGQACAGHGMKIMRPDLPGARVILCITCFQSLQTCLIAPCTGRSKSHPGFVGTRMESPQEKLRWAGESWSWNSGKWAALSESFQKHQSVHLLQGTQCIVNDLRVVRTGVLISFWHLSCLQWQLIDTAEKGNLATSRAKAHTKSCWTSSAPKLPFPNVVRYYLWWTLARLIGTQSTLEMIMFRTRIFLWTTLHCLYLWEQKV